MDERQDQWLFESIKMYKNLSMYDVQQPITTMDWVDSKSLCIATSGRRKNELMELLLPDKMIEDEEQGVRPVKKLKKDRDFRVNAGGFCRRKVTELKHIPETRLCVLSDEDRNGVSIWQIGSSDSDLMQEVKRISCNTHHSFPIRISADGSGEDKRVAFGSSTNSISIVDVETCQIIRNTENGSGKDEPITAIRHKDKDTLLCCCINSAAISCLDLRTKESNVTKYQCQGSLASFWTMSNIDSQSNEVLLLSTGGEVLIQDLRYLGENVERIQIPLRTCENFLSLSVQTGKKKDLFSVSGFDGNVYIFKRTLSDSKDTVEPLFQHEGHVMNQENQSDPLLVVKHLWHPWQQDLVMSAATDGSLHAWQYQLSGS